MPRKYPNIIVTVSGVPGIGKSFVIEFIKNALNRNGLSVKEAGEHKLKVGSIRMSKDAMPVWGKVE